MIGIGHIPTQDEAREAFVSAMAWAYEPKGNNDFAPGKTAEELAADAFDEFVRERIFQAFAPLQKGIQVVVDRGFTMHHNVN